MFLIDLIHSAERFVVHGCTNIAWFYLILSLLQAMWPFSCGFSVATVVIWYLLLFNNCDRLHITVYALGSSDVLAIREYPNEHQKLVVNCFELAKCRPNIHFLLKNCILCLVFMKKILWVVTAHFYWWNELNKSISCLNCWNILSMWHGCR